MIGSDRGAPWGMVGGPLGGSPVGADAWELFSLPCGSYSEPMRVSGWDGREGPGSVFEARNLRRADQGSKAPWRRDPPGG